MRVVELAQLPSWLDVLPRVVQVSGLLHGRDRHVHLVLGVHYAVVVRVQAQAVIHAADRVVTAGWEANDR